MKRSISLALLTILLFSVQQADAQLRKGELMLGGSLSFTDSDSKYPSSSMENSEAQTITINPQLGIGLGRNWMLGISAGYDFQKQETEGLFDHTKIRTSIFTPGLFVRKSFPIGQRFGVFGQAEAEYGFGEQTYKQNNTPETKIDITGYSVGVRPGAFYRASRRFIIEATIGNISYSSMEIEPEDPNNSTKLTNKNFTASLTSGLSLGFQIVL